MYVFFFLLKNKENKTINTYESFHVNLLKAIPLYVHYTGNTVIHRELQNEFFKDKLL